MDLEKGDYQQDEKMSEIKEQSFDIEEMAPEANLDIKTIAGGAPVASGETVLTKNASLENAVKQSQNHGKVIFGFKREDISGAVQKVRGKENIYNASPNGQEFFVKYVNRQEDRIDDIEGLRNEKRILDLLADSGVTPKAGELKIYPNEKRARLGIERLPGISLDRLDEVLEEKLLKEKADETIRATAEALNKIHHKNVLVVDINEGGFLLDEKDEKLSVRLVDFELACDLDNSALVDRENAFKFYSSRDIGLKMGLEDINPQSPDVLKKAEINRWARTLVEHILDLSDILAPVELSPEKKEAFDAMRTKISPFLEKKITERAKKSYQYLSRDLSRNESAYALPTEEKFVQEELKDDLPGKIEEELLCITLAEKMKARGIILSRETLDFMSRALNPELKERPADFSEYLSKSEKEKI